MNSSFINFQRIVKKYILFREGVLPQATGVLPRYRGKTPFCKVLGKGIFSNTSYDVRMLSLLCFVDKCSRYLMEKELSHYLQNFAIQSQISKRCASYPYVCLLPSGIRDNRPPPSPGRARVNVPILPHLPLPQILIRSLQLA